MPSDDFADIIMPTFVLLVFGLLDLFFVPFCWEFAELDLNREVLL